MILPINDDDRHLLRPACVTKQEPDAQFRRMDDRPGTGRFR